MVDKPVWDEVIQVQKQPKTNKIKVISSKIYSKLK